MKTLKKILIGLAVGCMMAASPMAHAQNAAGEDDGATKWHSGGRIHEIYNQLNLTDTQKKQLEANKQQNRARMRATRQAIRADKEGLQEELMKPALDMAKINTLHNQIKTLQSQMEDDKLSSILEVRAILTPDQFLKFVNLMHKRRQ